MSLAVLEYATQDENDECEIDYRGLRANCAKLISRIEQYGIAPSDNVKQADEETHRRVDEAVRNGRIVDKRVPVDFVLVPVEPSFAMREAGNVALDKLKSDSTMQSADKAFYVYHAMLAAAPEVKP